MFSLFIFMKKKKNILFFLQKIFIFLYVPWKLIPFDLLYKTIM